MLTKDETQRSVTGSLYVLTGPMQHVESVTQTKIMLETIVANQNKLNLLSRVTNDTASGLNPTTKRIA
jgi:hypothetical protein